MATNHHDRINLPPWLDDVLAESVEPTEAPPSRRDEPRRSWAGSCFMQPDGEPDALHSLGRGLNICRAGLGCISRQELEIGQQLAITPVAGGGEPVRVRVVHCTRTVQGYKVGCAFGPV